MATAQKRGFRFPWGGGSRHDEPEPPNDEPTLAQRLGAAPDDIGRGPFDLARPEPEPDPVTVADDGDAATPGATTDEPAANPDNVQGVAAEAAVGGEAVEGTAARVEDGAADNPAAVLEPTPTDPAVGQQTHAEPDSAASGAAWPETDRRSSRNATPPPVGPSPAASKAAAARRANPLMAGLVRAMREATRVARDEAVAALRSEADVRGETIRARTSAQESELRKTADAEVTAIREWSKTEVARIRQETEARIAARRAQLVADTEAEAGAAGDLFARLIATVHGYESETADFFDALMAEDDPARLAGMAERMPAPPPLDEFPADAAAVAPGSGGRATKRTGANLRPAPARDGPSKRRAHVTQALPAVEAPDGPPTEVQPAVAAAGSRAAETQLETTAATPVASWVTPEAAPDAVLERTPEPDALDADAAAAAEAAALVGLDGQTQLIVSGLASVGGIAAFKGGLMRTPGVSAVSVTAGSDGDFLFTATHAADVDIRDAIKDMVEFEARVIADDGASLVVVAHEPRA